MNRSLPILWRRKLRHSGRGRQLLWLPQISLQEVEAPCSSAVAVWVNVHAYPVLVPKLPVPRLPRPVCLRARDTRVQSGNNFKGRSPPLFKQKIQLSSKPSVPADRDPGAAASTSVPLRACGVGGGQRSVPRRRPWQQSWPGAAAADGGSGGAGAPCPAPCPAPCRAPRSRRRGHALGKALGREREEEAVPLDDERCRRKVRTVGGGEIVDEKHWGTSIRDWLLRLLVAVAVFTAP